MKTNTKNPEFLTGGNRGSRVLISVLSVIFCSILLCSAQTLAPPPIVPTNAIPNSLSFSNVNMEVYTAAAYQSGSTTAIQAKTGIYYNIASGFGPAVQIANETTGNVIAEMDFFFEYHKVAGSFEIIGGIGASYNWDSKHPGVKGVVGINYNLTQVGGTFPYMGTRFELGDEFQSNARPTVTPEIVAGLKF